MIYLKLSEKMTPFKTLTLFRMRFFVAAHEWGGGKAVKKPTPP